ncbi:uncharacterized protein LDX57_007970 [Aspergillus melleus]|uniref:uncharacterized protein n=1 Tax=Aspergillus melleus TaxID=138277 RepID=UPI001E8CD141|nr:uncharacterized protein LDX57_007970 [Aspergillus melleus]KAH8430306.1 hypothetical protein LDX57_007970 [Aspergillus melleus]
MVKVTKEIGGSAGRKDSGRGRKVEWLNEGRNMQTRRSRQKGAVDPPFFSPLVPSCLSFFLSPFSPYTILRFTLSTTTYDLDLPIRLKDRRLDRWDKSQTLMAVVIHSIILAEKSAQKVIGRNDI